MNSFASRFAVASFAVVALALAPRTAAAQPKTVTLLNYTTTVPAGWTSRTPSSSMRLAEYVVPTVNGANVAEVVVYFFGPGQGGTTDANLARWKSQFTNPDGGAVYEKLSRDSSAAAPLTIAEYRGTYARGVGAGSEPEAARPDNALVAIVAETPRGTLFFQLFGPIASVSAARDAYVAFARGLK